MTHVVDFQPGGYRYIQAVFQYSAGVAALPGFAIERVVFQRPPALLAGFEAIAAHLAQRGRPLSALCGCELRSPAPLSDGGFVEFNRLYVRTLQDWGLVRGDINPVARTNVCPVYEPPASPAFHAFSYTVPDDGTALPGFVVAGGGEAPEGHGNYHDVMVRLGDTSLDGLREKVRYVVAEMTRRVTALGFTWQDAVATQAYTVHDIGPLVHDELVQRGVARMGLTWQYTRPPIADMEYEMDLRRVARELVHA
ncbi:hypothetical protein CLU95_5999 [Variovorax sp. 54]|jgi:hypothetical protein|uniref:2-amino-5-chloromuconate deaminase CnbZ n=1 Tax=Variovorax sp. 54 TaxID=2035212 RepID=UPI000C177C31|nr:hypothetical protein [Variovorax sp. 54]PIF78801.1 hypothetical protein CLU95_5999 [Variovorax sp. 54]